MICYLLFASVRYNAPSATVLCIKCEIIGAQVLFDLVWAFLVFIKLMNPVDNARSAQVLGSL